MPNSLNSINENFTNSSLLSQTSSIFPHWLKSPNYLDTSPLPTLDTSSSKKENRPNSFFKTIFEYLSYRNFIQNHTLSENTHFYQNNNWFNLNSQNVNYEPLSNIGFGVPFLFKIYKCPICFRDTPYMFGIFDSIKTSSEHRCCFNCNLLHRTKEENKYIIDPKIKEFSINKIFSIIDKKIYPKSKLYLKCIKIPADFYQQLNFESQFDNIEKGSENNNGDIPSWLHKLLLQEEIIDLVDSGENNWAHRLTSSNDNNTEITRGELIQFIKLSNSTFGLFKFQKDHSIVYYFFAYLQLEKEFEEF